MGYAVVYEHESEMKCVGLKILYYGEKEFDIAFTDFHRKKINTQVQELFSYEKTGDLPHVLMDKKCNECDFYQDCDKESKVIKLGVEEEEFPETVDSETSVEVEDLEIENLGEISAEQVKTNTKSLGDELKDVKSNVAEDVSDSI